MMNNRKYGKPPYTVFVVHGGPGAPGEMAPVARELSTNWGVIEPLQTANSIYGQVEELKIVLEEKGAIPVTLTGYSWGAWLSFLVAAKFPSLVKKLILVSASGFEEKYGAITQTNRFGRLNDEEIAEIISLQEIIKDPLIQDKTSVLQRFGKIFSKADSYDPVEDDSRPDEMGFEPEIFRTVWQEASELRKSGKLLEHAKQIHCPVVAIHGDYDPHPAEGVEKPLSGILKDFRFILLKNCGHKPWIERTAKDRFYEILKKEIKMYPH